MNSKIKEFLSTHKESCLMALRGNQVITIQAHETAQHAFSKLINNSILSAPIVDDTGDVIGMLSMRDFTQVVLDLIQKPIPGVSPRDNNNNNGVSADGTNGGGSNNNITTSPSSSPISIANIPRNSPREISPRILSSSPRYTSSSSSSSDDASSILSSSPQTDVLQRRTARKQSVFSEQFAFMPALAISELARDQELRIIHKDASLYDIAKMLSTGKVHRVVVQDENRKMTNIVSQSAVIQFIAKNLDCLGDLGNKTVKELGLAEPKKLLVANVNDNTAEVFHAMLKANVSAVPVVDATGSIFGNLSFSDVKGIGRNFRIHFLTLNVKSFISHVRSTSQGEEQFPSIYCTPTCTLAHAVRLLSATKTHRLYVVNDKLRPVGIISLTDIFRTFTAE